MLFVHLDMKEHSYWIYRCRIAPCAEKDRGNSNNHDHRNDY